MSKGAILLLGVLVGNQVELQPDVLQTHYETRSACETAASCTIIREDYSALFPDEDVVIFCRDVKTRSTKVLPESSKPKEVPYEIPQHDSDRFPED